MTRHNRNENEHSITPFNQHRETGNGDDPERGPAVAGNVENYNVQKREEEIWRARQRVQETREELNLSRADPNGIDEDTAARIYHEQLKQFIIIIEPLLRRVFAEQGRQYWNDVELGSVVVDPPEKLEDGYKDHDWIVMDGASKKTKTFTGLETIVETSGQYTTPFTGKVRTRTRGVQDETITITAALPWNVLDRAFRVSMFFLSDIGLELEQDSGLPGDRIIPDY